MFKLIIVQWFPLFKFAIRIIKVKVWKKLSSTSKNFTRVLYMKWGDFWKEHMYRNVCTASLEKMRFLERTYAQKHVYYVIWIGAISGKSICRETHVLRCRKWKEHMHRNVCISSYKMGRYKMGRYEMGRLEMCSNKD